ncbi:MAG: glycosyltransferase family 2 protein [candidate division NC10 bacterium]|nr:glycosyltransferase family 2 protein [candidate division NC10 bacterium]
MSEPLPPLVSVVMPVRNEAALIAQSLAAVLAQDYAADRMEVIVVDGESSDGTREILEQSARSDPRLIILNNPDRIVPCALNLGILHARGEIVVRVDSHTVISSDYVRKCVEYLQRGDAENVGGPMRPSGRSYFGRAVAMATSSPFGIGGSRFHYSEREQYTDTVYLGAYRREALERIGLFDEELICNQDYELNYRLRAAGGRILCSPQIRSLYCCRESPRALFRQYFRYGFWKVQTLKKHPRSLRARQLVAPAFVGGILLLALSGLFFPLAWVLLLLGLFLYLALAGTFALVRILPSESLTLWPGTTLAFLILHLAWGLGFWRGILGLAGSERGGKRSRSSNPPGNRGPVRNGVEMGAGS